MRYIATVLAILMSLFGFWVAGFDFDVRGGKALLTYVVTLVVAGLIYSYPGWDER